MSTPSTATATLPPHHQFYPHHQSYQPNISNGQLANGNARIANSLYNGYANGGTSNSELRRTTTATAAAQRPTQQLPPLPAGSAEDMNSLKRRNPDWADFYKNGLPKEVIVIDDDEEEEPAGPPPPPRQAPPSRPAANGSMRHADKKRKTAASTAYDPVYNNQHTSYSTTQTPYDYSPNHSLSTDRTTSALNTTAATSLGSTASNGQHISPLENSIVGQKRKRTRAAAQDEAKEAKRRELDDQDPFALYQPPPNPVVKAKDVYVQVVTDVSLRAAPLTETGS